MKIEEINHTRITVRENSPGFAPLSFETSHTQQTIRDIATVTACAWNDGQKIPAIKVARLMFGCGLAEAKCFVEEAAAQGVERHDTQRFFTA